MPLVQARHFENHFTNSCEVQCSSRSSMVSPADIKYLPLRLHNKLQLLCYHCLHHCHRHHHCQWHLWSISYGPSVVLRALYSWSHWILTNTITFIFQVKEQRLLEVRELIQSYRAPKRHSWVSKLGSLTQSPVSEPLVFPSVAWARIFITGWLRGLRILELIQNQNYWIF